MSPSDNISLPKTARLPINRCNLPAKILGNLMFQQHPASLQLDGVEQLYKEIFLGLSELEDSSTRAKYFLRYMCGQFLLEQPEEMGLEESSRLNRSKATYLRLIRGWLFNPDSVEGAVLKGWVESRFGLIPRFHINPIRQPGDDHYLLYIQEWAKGLHNTNALENQLDLLYSYCQFELEKKYPKQQHLTLYRGCNSLDEYEVLQRNGNELIMLLNNVNSFSSNRERADEFGDYILEAKVPLSKIVFYNALLPGTLFGEEEYVVIGGLYRLSLVS